MIYLLIAAGFTLWVVCAYFAIQIMFEAHGFWSKIPILLFIFLTMAIVAYVSDNEREWPCVQYEQRMIYNPSLKMLMPARVCVERGEWVE